MVEVYRPDTLAQALDKLAVGEHTLFAGGTDLMVKSSVRPGMTPAFIKNVVFVDAIAELQQIVHTKAINQQAPALVIGAGVTLNDIEENSLIPAVLRQSVAKIAAPALRNRATMAGNICNASPAADTLPALYLLDARVVLSSLKGQRELAIEEFITGPGRNQLKSDEILTHIVIPCLDFEQTFYHKVGTRKANALTKLSVAGAVKVENHVIVDWRVAFGAVGPAVARSRELELRLRGLSTEELHEIRLIDEIVAMYREVITPIDDQRSTASYRLQASINLLRRWLNQVRLL